MRKAALAKTSVESGPENYVRHSTNTENSGIFEARKLVPPTEAAQPKAERRDLTTWTNQEARAALIRYENVIRAIARRLRPVAALGQALDEEDLHAEGRVAVLEALTTYQGFGIEEQTWVRTRIRQRMIDAIRRLDLRTRDEMRLAVRHAAGSTEGEQDHERGRVVAARRLVSLDSTVTDSEPIINRLRDTEAPCAEVITHQSSQQKRLFAAIRVLPRRQRQAIELGLFEGMPLREIGDRMGISESRVCQLQKRAVQHLQKAVRDLAEAEAA